MKKLLLLTLIGIMAFTLKAQESIIKFNINSKKELQKISSVVSIDNIEGNTVVAYANDAELEEFKTLNYDFEFMPHPSTGKSLTMATTVAEMASWDRYPTYSVYIQMMNDFASNHPDICSLENIGTSEDGREVLALKISDNPATEEAEPEYYYTGQMHGDEIVGYIMLLRLADHLLENYGTLDRVTNLVNNFEIWINPLSNPDGTYTSNNNTVSGATRYNSNSVDLNRNFPSPELPSPGSQNEAEIQMQIAFAEAHNFVGSSNLHSGIELVNYPWDSWTSNIKTHADHNWFEHVSRNYADTAQYNSPSGYMTGQDNGVTHGGDWYVVDGSRQDNMMYYHNCREITLELSDQKMLDSEDLPAHWNYNRDALIGFIEAIDYGFQGMVTNTNDEPLHAKVKMLSHDEDNSEVYTDADAGDYYRPIEPGTYDVTFSAEGYIAQTHSITVSDWETTTNFDVTLQAAAEVQLSGTVIDGQTGTPLENAEISFPGTSISPVSTNANGNYSLTVFEDQYQISAYKNGYAQKQITTTVTADNNLVDFALVPSEAITFETEIPESITLSGDVDWFRSNNQAYEGSYSVESGNISDDQVSTMTLTASTDAGTISFFRKISSESGYDFLKFNIDGTEQDTWSGESDWQEFSYNITAGSHTFTWEYEKDGSVSNGSDCGWIDYIELPSDAIATYDLTFVVTNGATAIENATVSLPGYGSQSTNASGETQFTDVYATSNASLAYTVEAAGFEAVEGTIAVTENKTITIDINSSMAVTPSSLDFGDVTTDESSELSYDLTASGLANDLTITAPEGYMISATSGSGFASSIVVPQSSGTIDQTVFVQFNPVTESNYTGLISNESDGAPAQYVEVTGNGIAPNTPNIVISETSMDFGQVTIGEDSVRTYSVSGSDLTNNVVVTVSSDGPFAISTDGTSYTNSITLTQSGGTLAETDIMVKYAPTQEGPFGNEIIHESTDANARTLSLSGDTPVGIDDMKNKISIYPNPATNHLTINNAENHKVILYDVSGKQQLTKTIDSNQHTISLNAYKKGVYVLKIFGPNNVSTLKFVKQ